MKTNRDRRAPSSIRIMPVEEQHLAACEAFIAAREWLCVYLSEKFIDFKSEKRESATHQAPEFFMLCDVENNDDCCGVLFVSRGGKVLHCFSEQVLESKAWKNELRSFFKGRKVESIMGEAKANLFLERICGCLFFNKTNFILMRRFRNSNKEAINPKSACAVKDAAVFACTEKDANALLPLQTAYEVEELGAKTEEAASEKTLMRLKACLRHQTVIACRNESTGKILGKAGTNAIGINWNQIGGVYTVPERRSKGIAQFMIYELVRLSDNEGKDAVLFVKPKNKAALRAYTKSGFNECGGFRMAHSE